MEQVTILKNNPYEVKLVLVKHCCGLQVTYVTRNYKGDTSLLKKQLLIPLSRTVLIKRRLAIEVYKSNGL